MAVPQVIAESPEPWPGLDVYLRVFDELATGRNWLIGMGAGSPLPISPRQRMDAAEERGWLPGSETYEEFAHVIRALDAIWLEEYAKKHRKKK